MSEKWRRGTDQQAAKKNKSTAEESIHARSYHRLFGVNISKPQVIVGKGGARFKSARCPNGL